MNIIISIHAPVKGATRQRAQDEAARRDFNPRTREGCDGQKRRDPVGSFNFNPRTREGCDGPYRGDETMTHTISIHAPVKGATIPPRQPLMQRLAFQSTHP